MPKRRPIAAAASLAAALLLAALPGPEAAAADVSEFDKLLASDGEAGDFLGGSVAVNGDTALVGASMDDDIGDNAGAAYVYRFDGVRWAEEAKLTASDGTPGDEFGKVAVWGDTAAVGAFRDDDVGANSGSAYVFRYDGTRWIEEDKLTAADNEAGDNFGFSIAIHGPVAVVGASNDDDGGSNSGAAYVFRYDGTRWAEEAKLRASNPTDFANLGLSVSIDGDTVVVGARNDNGTGAAYVFRYNGSAWVEEQRLEASDAAANELFGNAVAVYGDTAVISANRDDDRGVDSGSAYVFRYDGSSWIEEEKITASDAAPSQRFGTSVALSGDAAVIGASSESAYVFRYDGSAWAEEEKITASDGAAIDNFGFSVAISGETALVGAFGDDDNGSASGSAYVFKIDKGGPLEFIPSNVAVDGGFGNAVSIAGDVAVVGSSLDSENGPNSGSAFVFRYDGQTWNEETKLIAAQGAAGEQFGVDVAISGDTTLVGTPLGGAGFGSAFVFRYDATGWNEETELLASDGALSDLFGVSVAISGDTAVIGAEQDDDNGNQSGSAYVFRYDGTAWTQEAKLTAADGAAVDRFGRSVSISGDTAVIGAFMDDDAGTTSGSAYVFRYDGTGWVQEQKLTASDAAADDAFGDVAIFGDTIVVGAIRHDHGALDAGSAYVYRYDGSSWVEEMEILASDRVASDFFGGAVSLFGDTAVIGAQRRDEGGASDSGAAYVLRYDGTTWVEANKITQPNPGDDLRFGISVAVWGDNAVVGARSLTGTITSAHVSSLFPSGGSSCGDGVPDAGEDCDLGALNGDASTCCSASCTFRPPTDVCNGAADTCDIAELCTGQSDACPADVVQPLGTICRDPADVCDVAETCDGAGPACPADVFVAAGTVCDTGSGDGCDPDEVCSGSSAACPADVFAAAGTLCRGATDVCDVTETCSGTAGVACPADALATAGTVCRGAGGACDAEEVCTGNNTACPADVLEVAGTTCRAAAGICDVVDQCTGVDPACPPDAFSSAATSCRPAAGVCDVQDFCPGNGPDCAPDAVAATGTVCRTANGPCDATEVCTGAAPACPADAPVPDQTACNDGDICTAGDQCIAGMCGGLTCLTSGVCGTNRIDIDFGDIEAGCFFAKADPLGNQYIASGVLFQEGTGGVLHECSNLGVATSAPTFAGYSDANQFENGNATGLFDTMELMCPADQVRFFVASSDLAVSTLEAIARNGLGQEVDRMTVGLPTPATEVVLSGSDILFVTWERQDPGTFLVDDVQLVPEPTRALLALWAVIALSVLRLRLARRG